MTKMRWPGRVWARTYRTTAASDCRWGSSGKIVRAWARGESNQSGAVTYTVAASATATTAAATSAAAGAIPPRRRVHTRYTAAAAPASKADCLTSTAQPVRRPAAISQPGADRSRYRTNASSEATAKNDASSSPDNVNDSMNGAAPTVAIASPAMVAGI